MYGSSDMKKPTGSVESQKKRVAEIMRRFHEARRQKDHLLHKWRELDQFYRGEQYNDVKLPPWIPKPVTNYIHLVVTTKRAALAVENPSALFRAVSPLEVDKVREMQDIFDWVWKKIGAKRVVRQCIETSKLLGTAIAHVYWDEHTGVLGGEDAYYEGEIRICEIDPANFFPDPTAYRLQDCQYIHVVEKKPRKWVESVFKVKLDERGGDTGNDPYIEPYDRERQYNTVTDDGLVELHAHYERYWYEEPIMEKIEETVEVPKLEPNPETGEMVPVQEVDMETGMDMPTPTEEVVIGYRERPKIGPDGEPEVVGGWRYKVTYVCNGKILGTIDPLEPNMYPFAILYDFPQRQSFWGKSHAELILENQKLVNKVEGVTAMIGVLLQNPQRVMSRNAGIDPSELQRYSNAPGHVWIVNTDADKAIRNVDPPQVPPALLQLAEAAKANIREITGMNEAYLGESVGSLQTSQGVNSLIERATLRDRDQMEDLAEFLEQLIKLIMAFVTTKYTEERYMHVIRDPHNPDQYELQPFTGVNYRDIEYVVEVNVTARAPISMVRRAAEAKDLLQISGQYKDAFGVDIITPEEYIEQSDMVDKRKIINRIKQDRVEKDLDKLQQVLTMALEAQMNGVPQETVFQMAQNMLFQIHSGQLNAQPYAMNEMGTTPEGQGIGSAADNTSEAQMHQAEIPMGEES